MRRVPPLVAALLALSGWSFFDPFHEQVETGNEKAKGEAPAEALPHYEEAARLDPSSPVPDFNRGIVLSKENPEAARDAFLGAAAADDPQVAADALYNLGNVLLEAQEFAPAIESYLKSLDLDPDDEDARRNLEIAVRRMEEQQQQQQQQQDSQSDQESEQENDDREQQPEQDEEQNRSEDSQDEQQPQPQEGEQEEPQDEGPPEERLTREQAERLLNAIASDELKVLQQMQETDEKAKGGVTHDW